MKPVLSTGPDLVIRPSGIWNSRAPFHNWLLAYKSINRSYELTIVGTERTEFDLVALARKGRSTKKFFGKGGSARGAKAWLAYRAALGKTPDGELLVPTTAMLIGDLEEIRVAMRQSTLVRLYSAFEAFVNCWLLNRLLSKLETGLSWTPAERAMAARLSPTRGSGLALHASDIWKALPDVVTHLRSVPHVFRDPSTGKVLTEPISSSVQAYAAIEFWRTFRNLIVHSGGFCTPRFYRQSAEFWNSCFPPAGDFLPPLAVRISVPLFDKMLQSCQLALYRAALALSDLLEASSGGRRGHPWAPAPKPTPPVLFAGPVPALLLVGDHEASYANWKFQADTWATKTEVPGGAV